MDTEAFYGVTLSEKEPLAQFDVSESGEECRQQRLIIKQICLGAEAKNGEFNVVQAETIVNEVEKLKIPIAVLKAGETRVLRPNIEFPSDSVTFKLIQGTGPVYMYGQHLMYGDENSEWVNGDDDVEDEEYDDEPAAAPPQTNGKNNSNKKK